MPTKTSSVHSKRIDNSKSTRELINEFIAFKPDPKFNVLKAKFTSLMNQQELKLQNEYLTLKLNHVSKYLSRCVEK